MGLTNWRAVMLNEYNALLGHKDLGSHPSSATGLLMTRGELLCLVTVSLVKTGVFKSNGWEM